MKKKLPVIIKLLCYPSPFLWYDNSKGGTRKITYFTKDSIWNDKTDSNIISISEFDNENIGKKENTTKEESNKDDSSTKDEESENTSKDTSENK